MGYNLKTRSTRGSNQLVALASVLFVALLFSACSSTTASSTVIRSPEDVQVLTPKEVKDFRKNAEKGVASASGVTGASGIPQNLDTRPVETRLFDAYAKFSACLTASGDKVRGNLLDRENPAFQDPAYVAILSKCAARTGIIQILTEFNTVRAELNPKQVKERNKSFLRIKPCLEKRGWTIKTTTNQIGLLVPSIFRSPDGSINSRDLNQCSAQVGFAK